MYKQYTKIYATYFVPLILYVTCLFSFHEAWPSVLYSMVDRHPQRDEWKGRGKCVSSWVCVCAFCRRKEVREKGVTAMQCYDWCFADKPAVSVFLRIQDPWNLRRHDPPKTQVTIYLTKRRHIPEKSDVYKLYQWISLTLKVQRACQTTSV
jgi:hypothetical protein